MAGRFKDSPRAPKKLEIMARQHAAISLRRRGATYQDIASAMQKAWKEGTGPQVPERYDKTLAFRDVSAALLQAKERFTLDAGKLKELEVQRAEAGYALAWQIAGGQNRDGTYVYSTGERLAAMDRCEMFSRTLSRLHGLDAPTKIAPTDPTGDKPFEGVELSDEERARRLTAILEAAKARCAAAPPAPAEEGH